jgi:hypothetical protein
MIFPDYHVNENFGGSCPQDASPEIQGFLSIFHKKTVEKVLQEMSSNKS